MAHIVLEPGHGFGFSGAKEGMWVGGIGALGIGF